MQVRRAKEIVETSVNVYGEGNSNAIISCYIEVLTKHDKADVETMCTKEAIVEGWGKLTNKEISELENSNYDQIITGENGEKKYVYNEVNKTEKVNAQ